MRTTTISLLLLLLASPGADAQFSHDSEFGMRLDSANEREPRWQYRLKFKPSYRFDERWTVHAFFASGDDFDSAYNRINENDDEFHVRRLFGRYETEVGRIEFGVLPPFKGRVSSTGLSKEGWIKGARGVLERKRGTLELVLGQLDDLRARTALSAPDELNYVELEFSGRVSEQWSYELGFEHMLDDDYLRTEVRFAPQGSTAYTLEFVANLNEEARKVTLGLESTFLFATREIEWFTYYSYAPSDFGLRAELTEDFLEFGHAFAAEFSAPLKSAERVSWFINFELYEGRSRGKFGFDVDFD